MDFRSNDRDGNRKNDFWRADIAGLYAIRTEGGMAIKLIDPSTAAADDRPKTELMDLPRGPKSGYWYRALRFADEKEPDPDRYAACAFPDSPSAGKYTLIVNHKGFIYRKKGLFRDLEVFPADPVKDGWEKMD